MLAFGAHAAGAAELSLPSGMRIGSMPVKSMKDLRFQATLRQQYDFSCGSAALATLLTHHYATPTSEQDAFKSMFLSGDQQKIRREGFSLLDMQRFLAAHGFKADGFELPLEKLFAARLPAIVLISDKGYNHFVVIKGVNNGEVMVGDPAAGLKLYRKAEFEKIWTNGIMFVVRSRADIAKSHFNSEWANIARAPMGSAISRDSLANITLLRPGSGDF